MRLSSVFLTQSQLHLRTISTSCVWPTFSPQHFKKLSCLVLTSVVSLSLETEKIWFEWADCRVPGVTLIHPSRHCLRLWHFRPERTSGVTADTITTGGDTSCEWRSPPISGDHHHRRVLVRLEALSPPALLIFGDHHHRRRFLVQLEALSPPISRLTAYGISKNENESK